MNEQKAIQIVHEALLTKPNFPEFKAGDTIVVKYRIREGDKTREQDFRGDVIQIKGHGLTRTFTVRKISHGVGVERIFSISNPNIADIRVIKRGRVRRARLYYLRNLVGKKARIKERKNFSASNKSAEVEASTMPELASEE